MKKKMKKEEVDDYSHFVAVYDIDNDSELLEERHHDGRSERPATTTTTSVSTNSTSEDDCGESCILHIPHRKSNIIIIHTQTTNTHNIPQPQHPTPPYSILQHPTSYILHPTSHIPHPHLTSPHDFLQHPHTFHNILKHRIYLLYSSL